MGRIVVFDTETTGLDPTKADIIQIAAICAKPDFTPDRSIQPFYMLIKPAKYKDTQEYRDYIAPAMKVNHLDMEYILSRGFDSHKASELFEEWWVSLGSEPFEPLCQNYPYDSMMMKEWLGSLSFSHYFSRYYRDTYVAARLLKDQAEFLGCEVPFKEGMSLSKLGSWFGIENARAHDAFHDCLTTMAVWKRMCFFTHKHKEKEEKQILDGRGTSDAL